MFRIVKHTNYHLILYFPANDVEDNSNMVYAYKYVVCKKVIIDYAVNDKQEQ